MPTAGTLDDGNLTGNVIAWAGGYGVLAITGPMRETGDPSCVILENDLTGTYEPSGDAVLHSSPSNIGFDLPACNIRTRVNGVDTTTDIDTFID